MKNGPPYYLSYLLRLWRENNAASGYDRPRVWRASLEDTLNRKRQGFSSLDDLIAFLRKETGVVRDGVEEEGDEQV